VSDKGGRTRTREEQTGRRAPFDDNQFVTLPRTRAQTAAGWFNLTVEPPAGLEYLREVLARIVEEIRDSRRFLIDVADNVFRNHAEEAFEAAQGIPLKPQTIERKERARKRHNTTFNFQGPAPEYGSRTKSSSEKARRWRRRRITRVSVHPGILSYEPDMAGGTPTELSTLYAAFAAPFELGKSSNVALRFIQDDGTGAKTLLWGTKGLAGGHALEHIHGTRHMQARLAGLDFDKPDRRAAFDEDVRATMAAHVSAALTKAGAPDDWNAAVVGEWYF
jgi:hypothetical protein